MNPRQRILTLLNGGTPDRVPWMADLDYWSNAMVGRGEVPADFINSPAYFDFHRELGTGFYLQGLFPFKTVYDQTVVTRDVLDGSLRRVSFETPVGVLSGVWTRLPESFSEAPTTHLIRTAKDLAVMRYIYQHSTYLPDYAELERRRPLIGDQGVLLAYLPRSPFMDFTAEFAGIQHITEMWMDAPKELEETLRLGETNRDQAAAIALACPAECLMIPENLSSEAVGRRFFEQYLRGYEERWVARIHEAGKHSFVHMDGTLRGLLRQISSVGFDIVEAATPAPVGDLTFPEMRQLAGPNLILWGGIPGIYFTPLVSDGEFDRFVQEVLGVMTTAPRYVLGVADQVPPDGLRRRVARVAELVEKYGRY